jgi:hypothetical protein
MISWLEYIGPDPVLAELSSSSYLNQSIPFFNTGFAQYEDTINGVPVNIGYYYDNLQVIKVYSSGTSDYNSTVTASSRTTINTRSNYYPAYYNSEGVITNPATTVVKITQTTTSSAGITYSTGYGWGNQTSTTFTTDQNEYGVKFDQLVTTNTYVNTTEWTTSAAGSGSTYFNTVNKIVNILGADYSDTALTLETVTITGISSYVNPVANTVVQASPGEVLYLVNGDHLRVCKSNQLQFLTDVATTQTRATLSYVSPYNTSIPIYYLNQNFTYPEVTGESSESQTYRSLKVFGAPTTITYTEHTGVIPNPTSTLWWGARYTTEQGSYVISQLYANLDGGGIAPVPPKAFTTTITYAVYGKIPKILNFQGKLISYDEISQIDVSTLTSQYHRANPVAIDGTNFVQVTNADDPNQLYETSESKNILVWKTEPRIGLFVGYYEDNNVPNNPAISQAFVAYKSGVMTSPSSYAGQLSITGKTLLTRTTTGQISTTTFSPTYARFHRSNGGVALMPTSAAAYTADLTAVTYTTGPTSNATTTSQILSALGSGMTQLLGPSLIGGAAGYQETIYGNILGKVKIENLAGSRVSSFFSHDSNNSSTTASGSTLAASRIEFPALALTSQDGGAYFVGVYSYTDILND